MSLQIYTQLNELSLQLNSLLDKLLATLGDEYQLLIQQDSVQLADSALIKKQLTEQINNIDWQRTQLVEKTGYDNNKAGLARMSEAASMLVTDFSANWQTTEQLIQQCADKNQLNGIILEKSRRNIETRLSILRGQPLTPDSYTSRGTKSSGPDSRSLAHV